jgi:uncharacterized glyoxalase superfamily protein PhnB
MILAARTIEFLTQVFDAKGLRRFPDKNGKLLHSEVRIDDTVVMIADAAPDWPAINAHACPDAVSLLSYSQSSEPASPHYSDQTALYSNKQWVTDRFCESAIAAATVETITLTPPGR